jgi:hypothetical protein
MSSSETDPNTELLKSIAVSLKAIHTSLESLAGSIEGVAGSIEKAHEPEGDLGVHLVSSLKDLTSALHKRAQQERSFQPQQGRQPHQRQGGRRDDRNQQGRHQENRHSHHDQESPDQTEHSGAFDEPSDPLPSYGEDRIEHDHIEESAPNEQQGLQGKKERESEHPAQTSASKRPRPNRRGRGKGKSGN